MAATKQARGQEAGTGGPCSQSHAPNTALCGGGIHQNHDEPLPSERGSRLHAGRRPQRWPQPGHGESTACTASQTRAPMARNAACGHTQDSVATLCAEGKAATPCRRGSTPGRDPSAASPPPRWTNPSKLLQSGGAWPCSYSCPRCPGTEQPLNNFM